MGQAQIPLLNGATPAAPPGYQNARWQQGSSTGTDPIYGVPIIPDSCYVPNIGVAVVKTSSYTLSIADMGKLIIANSATAITFTLPNPVPLNALSTPTTEMRWNVRVANIGAGTLTLANNSLQIDGASASLTFPQFAGCEVFTDGTNYFTQRGAPNLVAQPYDMLSGLPGKPGAGAIVLLFTAVRAVSLPANFAGAYGSCGNNPTATATYTVLKNGSSIGTISISTSGVFTFATTGGSAQSLAAGDRITATAPSTQDATLSDVAFTLTGTR